MSIERDEDKRREAAERPARRFDRRVILRLGDASEVVRDLPGPFDCVFFDADRTSAPEQLTILLPKLTPDCLLLADNALSAVQPDCLDPAHFRYEITSRELAA